MILEDLERSALEKCGLNRETPILIGVSGGADSLALMHGLHCLGFNLVVAHLDHAIRQESKAEADFVARLAALFGLTFVRTRIDVRAVAEKEHESLEEAARNVRYGFLFKQARLHKAQAVAVAHHADDQVETVLMHFLRGAALPGLSGMPYRRVMPLWDEQIPLVRPLLGVWREEIEAFIAGADLTPCVDLSNQDTTYFRNRLRHELIPELTTYNPQVREILRRMADILQEEDRFLEEISETAWMDCIRSTSKNLVEMDCRKYLDLPKAVQRRLLRRAIAFLQPDLRDIGFDTIERAQAFIQHPSIRSEMDLAARLNLVIIKDILIIKRWEADLPDWDKPLLPKESHIKVLTPDKPVALQHGWQVSASLLPALPDDALDLVKRLGENEAWVDSEQIKLPLTVRGREEGERWQPLGMGGHSQKLSEFLINQKIDAHLRELWPLVCSAGQVVWIVGVRPSDPFKVTENTKKILHLTLERK